MNLLFTTYQGGLAGATYSIAFLTEGLAKRGHNVFLAGKKNSLLFALLKKSPVHLIPMRYKSKIDLQTIQHIRDIVQTEKIDIINAQSSKDRYLTIFAKWLYKLNVRIVHTRRQKPESIGGWIQNSFYIKGTNKIVVISDELKRMFVQRGFSPGHLQVIYNGTPSAQYDEVKGEKVEQLRKKFDIQPNDVVIGCVARMKKQEQLIRALPLLDKKIKVLFAGIPPGSLDHVVQQFNVKNEIIYAGDLAHHDVLHLYKLMDVNVLPSTMDGFGLVLVEAMALETPVVATRAGGIVDVVEDGVNGLLYENENIEDLAHKIKLVLYDQELRGKLIAKGKITALEKFSLEKTILNYEQFFYGLLKN